MQLGAEFWASSELEISSQVKGSKCQTSETRLHRTSGPKTSMLNPPTLEESFIEPFYSRSQKVGTWL